MTSVSHETGILLARYVEHLRKWQDRINLIGDSTLDDLWARHIEDSLQLLDLMPKARKICDLGSGGGLPGLALAIALRQFEDGHVTLVESNSKKCAFLRVVSTDLQLRTTICNQRIDPYLPALVGAEAVTARALAPLKQLCGWVEAAVQNGAIALFPKGRTLAQELEDASKMFSIEATVVPSTVSTDSGIVVISKLARR